MLGFRRLQWALSHLPPTDVTPAKREDSYQAMLATVRMVRAATRWGLRHANCLEQSLVLWRLLRRQGIESDLRIGVRKVAGRLEAHAWVERLGLVLNDSTEVSRHFLPFEKAIIPPAKIQ